MCLFPSVTYCFSLIFFFPNAFQSMCRWTMRNWKTAITNCALFTNLNTFPFECTRNGQWKEMNECELPLYFVCYRDLPKLLFKSQAEKEEQGHRLLCCFVNAHSLTLLPLSHSVSVYLLHFYPVYSPQSHCLYRRIHFTIRFDLFWFYFHPFIGSA